MTMHFITGKGLRDRDMAKRGQCLGKCDAFIAGVRSPPLLELA